MGDELEMFGGATNLGEEGLSMLGGRVASLSRCRKIQGGRGFLSAHNPTFAILA